MALNQKALDKVISGTTAERTYLCSHDFSLFMAYYFTEYIKYPFAPFHFDFFDDIKNLLNGTYREVAWIAFRESAKTSIAKIFLVWLIVYKKRKYLNVDSFSITNAERILFDVVYSLQTNQKLKHDFGEVFNSQRDQNEASQKRINNFVTNNGVRVEAHSTGKSVRGRLHGSQRPDFLLLDDFETNETKDSKANTLSVIGHIDEFKSGLDSTALVLYLGNYITEYGSIETIRKRSLTDDRLKFHMVNVLDDKGQPTWPTKYALTTTEAQTTGKVSIEDKRKQLGSQVFNVEMMNRPIDEETQEFFSSNFKPISFDKVKDQITRKFVTIDSALSKSAESDSTGVVRNYVNERNDWNIDAREYRFNSKGLIDLIFQLHDEKFEKIGVEDTVFVQAIEPFFLEECRKRNKYPYIIPLKHGGVMKETRIRGLIPRYESGSIYHIEGKCTTLEEQELRFPRSLHDDVLDALAYQLHIAEPPFPQSNDEPIEDYKPMYSDIGI